MEYRKGKDSNITDSNINNNQNNYDNCNDNDHTNLNDIEDKHSEYYHWYFFCKILWKF